MAKKPEEKKVKEAPKKAPPKAPAAKEIPPCPPDVDQEDWNRQHK